MKKTLKVKHITDVFMTAALLISAAYQVTGGKAHEYSGIAAIVLFVFHCILNRKWFASLFKGKYGIKRALRTAVNISMLVCVICLGFSGAAMSRYALAFLPLKGISAMARGVHLASSYWALVLASLHIGAHLKTATQKAEKYFKERKAVKRILFALFSVIALYGFYCFAEAGIPSYMLLISRFAFFDYEKSALTVFIQYAAIMEFFAFTAYSADKLWDNFAKKRKIQKNLKGT